MGKGCLLCVLLGSFAWAQAVPPASPTPQNSPSADSAASVPPTAAVMTIKGICAPAAKTAPAKGTPGKSAPVKPAATSNSPADCKTVITRDEFEKLAGTLSPNVTPQLKKQIETGLPRLLAMSAEAKKQGIDKTDQFKDAMKFVQMQVLANELQRKYQAEAADISDADLEKYYNDHKSDFAQYNIDRIFVPRAKQGETATLEDAGKKPTEEEQKAKQEAAEQAMTKLADDLRTRAAAGEDFLKLQKEAFEAAGMKIESPTVNLPNVRRTAVPAGHAAIFDLKPGEVSQVISDPGGHYIYKVNSKTEIPLEQAKTEIHSKLQNDRLREKVENINNSFTVETNEAYFGPAGPAPVQARPGMGQMPPRQVPRSSVAPNAPSSQPQSPPPAQPPAVKQN